MAIYKIKIPDGRIISIKGDTPPTEQDIDNIVLRLPKKEIEKPTTVAEGVKSLIKGQEFISPLYPETKEEAREKIKSQAELALQAAQTGAQIGLGGAGAALRYATSPVATAATEFAIQKVKGKPTKESLKEAAIASGIDVGVTGIGDVIKGLTKPVLKKVIEAGTGIKEEMTDIALKNPEIFKGKYKPEVDFRKLGEKVIKAQDYVFNKAKEAVTQQKKALADITKSYNFNNLADNVDNRIISTWTKSGEELLTPLETKKIQAISDRIRNITKKGGAPEDLLAVRETIDRNIKWGETKGKNLFNSIMKETRADIKTNLEVISPKFKKVNQDFAEVIDLKNKLKAKIGREEAAPTNLKNIIRRGLKTEEITKYADELEKLDELSPKNLKFSEDAKKIITRGEFERWQPQTSLLRNIRLYGALGGGGYGYGTGQTGILAGAAGLGAITTPKVYKKAIQTGALVAPFTPAARITKTLAKRLSDYIKEKK